MSEKIELINIDKIFRNENQPRKEFDESSLKSLSESIQKYGVLQPIIVKKVNDKFMIVAGERRYRASVMLNLKKIPAIIKNIKDEKVLEVAIIENLQREDLSFLEEVYGYKNLIENHNKTQEEVSKIVGKSRPYITNILRLLNLDSAVLDFINNKDLTVSHGKVLLQVCDKLTQIELSQKIIKENLNVRQTEKLVNKLKNEKNKKQEVKKDIFLVDMEERLEEIFNTKVNIKTNNKKGKIEIEYYSEDDLENIISILTNNY